VAESCDTTGREGCSLNILSPHVVIRILKRASAGVGLYKNNVIILLSYSTWRCDSGGNMKSGRLGWGTFISRKFFYWRFGDLILSSHSQAISKHHSTVGPRFKNNIYLTAIEFSPGGSGFDTLYKELKF